MKLLTTLGCLTLTACAITPTEGMLASINKPQAMEAEMLRSQCDLGDQAACYFLRGRLPTLPRIPVIQGIAPATKAVLVAQVGPLAAYRYFLRTKENQSLALLPIAKTYTRENSEWRLDRLEITGLEEGKSYELIVTDLMGQLVDVRGFAPFRPQPESFRFAVLQGNDDRAAAAEESDLWKNLLARRPQLLLGLGNLVSTTGKEPLPPAALWDRYAQTRQVLGLFREPELVPVAAVWNEQDYGTPGENADRTNKNADAARNIQEAFFPVIGDGKTIVEGPGVSKALRLGEQTFVLFDGRSFRDAGATPRACRTKRARTCPPPAPDDSWDDPTHFGRLQESWAMDIVRDSDGPTWLLSADAWFGGDYPISSFEGSHPRAFREFLDDLEVSLKSAAKAKHYPVPLFVSANPLFTEAKPVRPFAKVNYGSAEISTGPFAPGIPAEGISAPGPRSARDREARFVFLTSWPKRGAVRANAEAVAPGNRSAFAYTVEARSIVPAPKAKISPKRKARR